MKVPFMSFNSENQVQNLLFGNEAIFHAQNLNMFFTDVEPGNEGKRPFGGRVDVVK